MSPKINLDPKPCLYCNVLFSRRKGESYQYFHDRKFCKKEHYFLWNRGINHSNYKTGIRKRSDGYLRLSNDQYIHRQVVSEALGRPLNPDEFIHHKDDDPANNDISNLEITTNSAHRRFHVKNQKRDRLGRFVK